LGILLVFMTPSFLFCRTGQRRQRDHPESRPAGIGGIRAGTGGASHPQHRSGGVARRELLYIASVS
jgi:hypothetical protein